MYYPGKLFGPLVFIGIVLLPGHALAQTNKPATNQVPSPTQTVATIPGAYTTGTPVNYVRTREAMGRITDINAFNAAGYADVKEATQYLDGLGRPLQTVMRQATPSSSPSDIVMPNVYDDFGREIHKYLPYVHVANDGAFKIDPFNAQKSFYQDVYPSEQPAFTGEQVYYSQENYEPSPLNRPLKSLAPGNSWAGCNNGVEQQYLVNTLADAVQIWEITNDALTYTNNDITTNIPVTSVTYDAGQLYKNITKDELGNVVVEYNDKEGKMVLKKVQAGTVAADFSGYDGFLCTYYVYDDLNQLRFVIPPKAVKELPGNGWDLSLNPVLVSELCYRYEYDDRQRMIAKKVPGAEWVYMIYDNRDRLLFTQDSYFRRKSAYLGIAYDQLNRPVATGFYYPDFEGTVGPASTPAKLQSLVTRFANEDATTGIDVAQPPPDYLYVSVRKKTDNVYQAIKAITFTDEFSTEDRAECQTQFVTFYDWVGSRVAVSGNLYGDDEFHVDDNNPAAGNVIMHNYFEPLTITHYDDYNWTTQGFTDRYNTKLTAGNNLHAENLPSIVQQSTVSTLGMVTGTETRILPSSDYTAFSSYRMLYSIPFYDDRGRVIQTQSNNYKDGVDIQTNLYDFTGKVLSNYLIHTNLDANMLNLRVKTDMEYDVAGRLLKTWKTIADDDTKKALISQNDYDALGKLKQKQLGQKRNLDGTYSSSPLETLDYSYNIRGWLKGINRDYANNDNSQGNNNRWFGMELSYDYGFQTNQLNGNIGGIKWRSAGDGAQRAYGFGYDPLNRLLYGDFNQLFGTSTWDKSDPNSNFKIDFSTVMGDGSTASSAYDENGNIKAMKQWGLKVTTSSLIDDLKYTYSDYSNKLQNVKDFQSDPLTKLGDFRTSALHPQNTAKLAAATDNDLKAITDYTYDANGNLNQDLNKDISGGSYNGILYNYLNLPVSIPFGGSNYTKVIEYTYDASGNKLSKNVVGGAGTTDYIGPMVYQDNVLQFISDEEGRIRYKPAIGTTPASFVYDYFIKDHLGNVRMVLTDEQQQDIYPAATLEGNVSDSKTAAGYENLFYNINSDNIVDKSPNVIDFPNNNGIPNTYPAPPDNTGNSTVANNSQKVYQLIGTGTKTGLGVTLKVMAGDQVDIFGRSYYLTSPTTGSINTPVPVLEILNGLLGAPGSAIASGAHGAVSASQLNDLTATTGGIGTLLGAQTADNPPGSTIPKAYINYIFFDEQFKYAGGGSSKVDPTVGSVKQHHTDLQNITVPKNGYVYIYCSNESPVPVFFDNLQVVHTRGPLLEETHYYPFGLSMAGISSKALKSAYSTNKRGFNGGNELQSKEFSDGSGLEMYDAVHRLYDPQIGRFAQLDELGEVALNWSQYSFSFDNPINFNDPSGLEAEGTGKKPRIRRYEPTQDGKHLAEVLYTAYVTAPHSTEVLINTYWAYRSSGRDFMTAPRDIRDWLINYNSTQQFREKLHRIQHEEEGTYLEIASWFIPIPGLGELKIAGKLGNAAAKLFRLRKGIVLAEEIAVEQGTQQLLKTAPAKLTQDALEHIVERHWGTSGATKAGKFLKGTTIKDLKQMIQTASTEGVFRPNTFNRPGTIAEYEFDKVIGTASNGASASSLRVVIGRGGNVITAFPF